MGAPTIIIKQFDVFAGIDEIEAILEIGNGEWSRIVEFEGYDYTVIVSDRFTNPHIEAKKGKESDTIKRTMIVKYWMVGVTPQSWGQTADDPLGFGQISKQNVHIVYYPLSVEACPCIAIGWVEGFTFANRTHIKIKKRGYQTDPDYTILWILGNKLFDELTSYGVQCRISQQDVSFAESDSDSSSDKYVVQNVFYGPVNAPVISGQFQSATTIGGGEAVDQRGAQGPVYKPQDIEQDFNTQGDSEND